MSKVLITGISGFIGSHILEHILVNTDWDIVGVASWKHKGTPERIEEVLSNNNEWRERVTIITHDLESPFTEMTKKRIGQVDYIINAAAESHVERSITDPVPFVTNNVALILNMLEFAREHPVKAFLQVSTDEVYGVALKGTNHKEWSSIVPSNPYSASKACQEAIAIAYWRTFKIPLIITNTMNNFGEMQDSEKFVAKVIRAVEDKRVVTIHGDGKKFGSRFYLHARNHADAILFLLTKTTPTSYTKGRHLRPDRYNVVGSKEINNLEMAETVAEICGKRLKYEIVDFHKTRPGHDERYALDGTKIRLLGWKPPVGFYNSMVKYINWTKDRPRWF